MVRKMVMGKHEFGQMYWQYVFGVCPGGVCRARALVVPNCVPVVIGLLVAL